MNLIKLLNPQAEPTREIIFTRNCTASGKGWKSGDRATLSEKVAQELIASDAAYDPTAADTAEARAKQLNELLPPAVTPEELPEDWKSLPEPFAKYHKLNAAYQALCKRQDAIWDVLLPKLNGYTISPDVRSLSEQPFRNRSSILQRYEGKVHVGTLSEESQREQSYLKEAYHRAEKACRDWQESNNDEAFRARILCGDEVQELCENLCLSIRELHKTGMEIFGLRIAGLGLSGRKVTELYAGSADAEKYSCFDEPRLNNCRLAYYEEGVGARSYVDQPVIALVSHYRRFLALQEEVTAALKQAKAELARTSRISAAA